MPTCTGIQRIKLTKLAIVSPLMTSNLEEHATDLGEAREKEGIIKGIRQQLNFFRVHILFLYVSHNSSCVRQSLNLSHFSVSTPLLISVIFYASNGRYKISYIDSLFNCVSAMTVCGLATVDLSSLTPFQQSLLFFQMCIGNPVSSQWSWSTAFGRLNLVDHRSLSPGLWSSFESKQKK